MNAQEIIKIQANDHKLRSAHIQKLVQSPTRIATNRIENTNIIPKTLIQFWDNFDSIPEDVQQCLDSWRHLDGQGFSRLLFNSQQAEQFIGDTFDTRYIEAYRRCHHPAMKCDYFRLCYVYQNGGFYLDADELNQGINIDKLGQGNKIKLNPMCYDNLNNEMVAAEHFIVKMVSKVGWIYYVNNNPIIAPSNHPLLRLALNRATDNLLHSPYPNPDIQGSAGPGNLSASLVEHALTLEHQKEEGDYELITNWDRYSISPWPLSYRNDQRNWRLYKP
jgi:mannosyltransferase OCH1-like enzyme